MLGRVDILSNSQSDPGQSGELSPFTNVKSAMFDDSIEPNDFKFEFTKFLQSLPEGEIPFQIMINADSNEEYTSLSDYMVELQEAFQYVDYTPAGLSVIGAQPNVETIKILLNQQEENK